MPEAATTETVPQKMVDNLEPVMMNVGEISAILQLMDITALKGLDAMRNVVRLSDKLKVALVKLSPPVPKNGKVPKSKKASRR